MSAETLENLQHTTHLILVKKKKLNSSHEGLEYTVNKIHNTWHTNHSMYFIRLLIICKPSKNFTFYPSCRDVSHNTPHMFLVRKIVGIRPVRSKSFFEMNYVILCLGWEKFIVEYFPPFASTELSDPRATGVHLIAHFNISPFLLRESFITITRRLFA
jgi:hypothetical protein